MMREMQKLIALMHYSVRGAVQPTNIMYATHPDYFIPGEQQDSSEFLGHLLNLLHDQEITLHFLQDQSVVVNDFSLAAEAAEAEAAEAAEAEAAEAEAAEAEAAAEVLDDEEWSVSGDFITVTDRAFAGQVATIYKCLTCGTKSRNDDSFRELQLSFPERTVSGNLYTVQNLVDMYCSPESLDGDNQYFCCHCQCLRDGERCIQMIKAPLNIILTLKQFNFEKEQQIRNKLMHNVFHNEIVSRTNF